MSAPKSAAALQEEANAAARIAAELANQAAAARRAEIEASKPRQPVVTPDDTVVLYFEKYQSGRAYGFAAIGFAVPVARSAAAAARGDVRHHVRWAVTGEETRRFNWAGLLQFVGEANWATLVTMTGGTHLLPPGAEPPVAERMGPFGRVLGTDDTSAQQGW